MQGMRRGWNWTIGESYHGLTKNRWEMGTWALLTIDPTTTQYPPPCKAEASWDQLSFLMLIALATVVSFTNGEFCNHFTPWFHFTHHFLPITTIFIFIQLSLVCCFYWNGTHFKRNTGSPNRAWLGWVRFLEKWIPPGSFFFLPSKQEWYRWGPPFYIVKSLILCISLRSWPSANIESRKYWQIKWGGEYSFSP